MQTKSQRDQGIRRRAALAEQARTGSPGGIGKLPDLVTMTPDELRSWRPPANPKMDKLYDVNISGLLHALTGHDLSMRLPPYEPLDGYEAWDPELSAPSTHFVEAYDSGALQVNTVINRDAAFIKSKAELQMRIEPMFGAPDSRLSFRPWVSYWANRYLIARSYAWASCKSHSDAWIRSTVMSTARDGVSDGQWEGDSRGFKIWDDRITDDEFGHIAIADGPDFEGIAPWEDLEVKVDMHKDRIYWGRVRIESQADADGVGLLHESRSSVALYVDVKWAWVEQSGPQYHG